MRWFVKPLVWLAIILFIVLLTVISGLSFMEFVQLREKNDNQIVTEFKFVADANYYRSLPITWLIIAILCTLVLVISVLILLVLLKRLRIALAILKEASKAVGYNFFSLFWPFIPFLLQIGVFAYWVTLTVHLATAGKPIYRVTFNETMENLTNASYGEICDPIKWNTTDGMNGECVFWEYGYNPDVDLDSILNGMKDARNVIHYRCFYSYVYIRYWTAF